MYKRITITIIFVLSFVLGFAASYSYLGFSKIFVKSPKESEAKLEENNFLSEDSYNVLLLGYGGAGHDGGNLSDVIIVVNVNVPKKKVTFISIPRDLWVAIPTRSDMKQNFKINAAYAIGTDDTKY